MSLTKIKAVVFDLDGTLIDYDYNLSNSTAYSLRKLKENGYLVVLNSGRPAWLAKKTMEDKMPDFSFDYIFGSNGAEFYLGNDEYELLNPLSKEAIIALDEMLDLDCLVLGIYDENNTMLVNKIIDKPEFVRWFSNHLVSPKLCDFKKIIKHSYPKMVGLHLFIDREKVASKIEMVTSDAYDFAFSSPMVLEIVAKGSNKYVAIEKLKDLENISDDEILSFGDSYNDLLMLKKTNGCLMANGIDELKEHTKYHCGAVDEDGIYNFLRDNHLL